MIANISPAVANCPETVSTLRFAREAKRVKNQVRISPLVLRLDDCLQAAELHLPADLFSDSVSKANNLSDKGRCCVQSEQLHILTLTACSSTP